MRSEQKDDYEEQDNIEWISGSTLALISPRTNHSVNRFNIHIPLKCITFNRKTSNCMSSEGEGDMALLIHGGTREISICLHFMKDEISFGIKEIEEFRVIMKERSIILKLRPNFPRTYYYHSEGYPYKTKPVQLHKDPTDDNMSGLSCFNIKPGNGFKDNELRTAETLLKKLLAESRNSMRRSDQSALNYTEVIYKPRIINNGNSSYSRAVGTYMNPNIPGSASQCSEIILKNKEIYITCIIPTQKRVIIYSFEGILSHLKFYIKQRFDWKWERMWYKNKYGVWTLLNEEGEWKQVKRQIQGQALPRVQIFMR